MIDVLVIVVAVVVVGLVIGSRRMKTGRKRAERSELLPVLAPVVGGSLSPDQVLTGSYRGYAVQASLATTFPTAPNHPGTSQPGASVETIRVRLLGTPGGQPWRAWRVPLVVGRTWHFAKSDGSDFLPFAGALARLGGLPPPDADLPDRLRAAGLVEALENLGPPTNDSLPHIEFRPDLRPLMVERMRTIGSRIPPAALQLPPDAGSSLAVEVERGGEADPSPQRFAEILDTAVAIAEINARANPATTAA